MLKQIHQFITENTRRLSSQLSTFESNVALETNDIRASFIPSMEQVSFKPGATGAAAMLNIGQMAMCDSTLGNVVLSLAPSASPGWMVVVKMQAPNNVTTFATGQKNGIVRLINGAASRNYVQGLRFIYFDGSNWWT